MPRRFVVSWSLVVLAVGGANVSAQGPTHDVNAGFAASGPTRYGAEYLTFGASTGLAQRPTWSLRAEGTFMLRTNGGQGAAACPAVVADVGYVCDARELSHVGRLGVTARYAPFAGLAPYVVLSGGGWLSSWQNGERLPGSGATPYGGVFDAGLGMPLPDTDRRTTVELRYGLFRQFDTGGRAEVRGGSLRVAIHRLW